MWTNNNVEKKFLTPPPTWRKQRPPSLPMSERKTIMSPPSSSANNNYNSDLFHIIHKVPAGDSPYVRAKHIQLIDKDPGKAISMFWAAINAGDRVDSALKDMAVVMKQLDRSDEAIEAIKSFRHLCNHESQESLDNVLIELYKRSGRIEEEIEMLKHKLENIENGIAFGGARTKMARSQGKKIQITIEQERARILGNLAWAYMQQNDYETAEPFYRQALSLETDKNKQCNLAICLMHMNKVTEAKFLIQAVRASAGNRVMDSSYGKSYERAYQMLTELEGGGSKEVNKLQLPGSPVLLTQPRRPPSSLGSDNRDHQRRERWGNYGSNKVSTSEPPVQFTQPRRQQFGCNFRDYQVREKWGEEKVARKLLFDQTAGSAAAAAVSPSPAGPSNSLTSEEWRRGSWRDQVEIKDGVMVMQPSLDHKAEESNGNGNSTDAALHKEDKKSWADLVEEEEEGLIGFNDENLNSNIIYKNQSAGGGYLSRKFEDSFILNDGGGGASSSSRNQTTARRSLCFDQQKQQQDSESEDYLCDKKANNNVKRRNRLQVFQDITPNPDSP